MARICRIRRTVSHVLAHHLDQLSADELRQLAQQLGHKWRKTRAKVLAGTARVALAPDQDRSTDPTNWRCTSVGASASRPTQPGRAAPAVRGNDRYRSGGDGDRAGAVVHAIRQTEGPGQTPAAAGPSPRAPRFTTNPTRPPVFVVCQLRRIGEDVAETGLHPRQLHGGNAISAVNGYASRAKPDPGAGPGAGNRQGHAHQRPVDAGADRQISRSSAAVPAGTHLRTGWVFAIPRSTLAQWVGQCGVALQPLVDALKQKMRPIPVLHADETPVALLNPGSGKTDRAYPLGFTASVPTILSKPWFMTLPTVVPLAMPATFRRLARHAGV